MKYKVKKKYFFELSKSDQQKYIKYYLDMDTIYDMYCNHHKEFMKLMEHREVIDDYTFGDYYFNNFDFLTF
jgi:hypothetical protein